MSRSGKGDAGLGGQKGKYWTGNSFQVLAVSFGS